MLSPGRERVTFLLWEKRKKGQSFKIVQFGKREREQKKGEEQFLSVNLGKGREGGIKSIGKGGGGEGGGSRMIFPNWKSFGPFSTEGEEKGRGGSLIYVNYGKKGG